MRVVHIVYNFIQYMGVKAQEVEKIFKKSNQYLSTLHDGFQKYLSGVSTLGATYDGVWTLLHDNDPVLFPSGHRGCSVSALATQILAMLGD